MLTGLCSKLLPTKSDAAVDGHWEWNRLANAYILGDKLQTTSFRNDIVTALVQKLDEGNFFPDESTVKLIYENTVETSPLRRLVVHMYAAEGSARTLEEDDLAMIPKEFFFDLSKKMLGRTVQSKEKINPSQYFV